MDVLVMLSGLPGTGKSALADALGRHLRAPVVSVDPIEAAICRGGIPLSSKTGVAAYEVGATLAEHHLRLGLDVVADAANYLEVGREFWRTAAERAGAAVRVVEVICSDVSVHQRRLRRRDRAIEGFPEPTWDTVEKRRDEWEPWAEPRLVVDSVEDLDANLSVALAYLAEDLGNSEPGAGTGRSTR